MGGKPPEGIRACFLRRLHMGSLPTSAIISDVILREKNQVARAWNERPRRTQLYVSMEAELYALVLNRHLMHKKVAVESLPLFLTWDT